MRAWIALAVVAGCSTPAPYVCATDPDCGDGFCEAGGLCSVVDTQCPSGRRYGELAGASSGDCVEGGTMVDDETALCGVTAARPDGTGTCAALVCDADPSCCEISWDRQCARTAEARCDLDCTEIVAAGGYQYAAAFPLDAPRAPLWTTNHTAWNYNPMWGDIEGDGRPDLAIAREGSAPTIPGLAILQSTGLSQGSLVLTPAAIGGDFIDWTREVEWRDFDADGDLDLLASGPGGVWVVVTDNDTFTAHQLTTMPAAAAWMATSSTPPWQIAVVYQGSPQNELFVQSFDASYVLATGTSFGMRGEGQPTWCHISGTPARDMIVGTDVFVANSTGFASPMPASGDGYLPSCADLDGDGDNDLVTGDYDTLKIILNNGGLTSTPIEFPLVFASGIGIADFDNNGRLDIVAMSGTNMRAEIPILFIDNLPSGFEMQNILPDWNTIDYDSQGVDVGRLPSR